MELRVVFIAAVLLWRIWKRKSRATSGSMVQRHVDNAIGLAIADEVARAEADLVAVRTRAQGVLAISGGLVTVLAGVLALAVGKGGHLELESLTLGFVAATLLSFVLATGLVLVIFLPAEVRRPSANGLWRIAKRNWDESGWDQKVAVNLGGYLVSLRNLNESLFKKLALAIFFQVVGILGVALLGLSLLSDLASP